MISKIIKIWKVKNSTFSYSGNFECIFIRFLHFLTYIFILCLFSIIFSIIFCFFIFVFCSAFFSLSVSVFLTRIDLFCVILYGIYNRPHPRPWYFIYHHITSRHATPLHHQTAELKLLIILHSNNPLHYYLSPLLLFPLYCLLCYHLPSLPPSYTLSSPSIQSSHSSPMLYPALCSVRHSM